jgi:transaldolase
MKLYGAGSIEDIRRCTALGSVGILTNPQGFDQYFGGTMTLEAITEAIAAATELPFFMQIHGESASAIVTRALELHAIVPGRVGFKIVSDEKGFTAIRELQQQGVKCIATTLFSVSQAAVAAAVGAFGVCPFVSRGLAIGMDMHAVLRAIAGAYRTLEHPPQIIAVSLKGLSDVELAISAGVDAVGMRYPLMKQMMEHPLSEKAELLFAKNWRNVKGEDVGYLDHALGMHGVAEDSVH